MSARVLCICGVSVLPGNWQNHTKSQQARHHGKRTNYLDLSDPATVERLARKADEIGLGAFWIESPSEPQEGDFPSTTMTFDFDAWAAAIIAALREGER